MRRFFEDDYDNDNFGEPDRYWRNNSDGSIFAGYNDPDSNTTSWYSSDGSLDSISTIPDDNAQIRNDEGY